MGNTFTNKKNINKKSNKKTIFVIIDIKKHIDNELLLYFLEKCPNFYFIFIFTSNDLYTEKQSMDIWLNKYKRHIANNHLQSSYQYTTLQSFSKLENKICDILLLCAPTYNYNGSNLIIKDKLFIQGNLKDIVDENGFIIQSASYNSIHSRQLLDKFKNKLVQIPIHRSSQIKPTTKWLRTLPDILFNKITIIGFKNIFTRIIPNNIIDNGITQSKILAPQLINPNIGNAEHFYHTQSYIKLFNINFNDFKQNGRFFDQNKWNKCNIIAQNYFKQVYNTHKLTKDVYIVQNIQQGPIKYNWDMNNTIYNLTLINYAIQYFIPNIWNYRKLPFYQNNFNKQLLDYYYHSIKTVYSNKIVEFLNPIHSLFAGYAVIEYLLYGQKQLDKILLDMDIKEIFNRLQSF